MKQFAAGTFLKNKIKVIVIRKLIHLYKAFRRRASGKLSV